MDKWDAAIIAQNPRPTYAEGSASGTHTLLSQRQRRAPLYALVVSREVSKHAGKRKSLAFIS